MPSSTPWCGRMRRRCFQMPEAERRKQMQGIVTCAIRITHVEGKLKFSQNRSLADQQQVAETLQQSADPGSRDVGTLSRQALARIGATEEGTFRNHMIMPGGRIRHSVYFSITDDEWPRVKAHLEGLLTAYPATSAGLPSSPSGRGAG